MNKIIDKVIESFRFAFLHLRVGYVFFLLLFVLPFIILSLIDIYRFKQLRLSLELALDQASMNLATKQLWHVIVVLLFFSVGVPIVVAIVRIFSGSGRRASSFLGIRNLYIIFFYIICCFALGFSYVLGYSLQEVSGSKNLYFTNNEFLFTPWLTAVMDYSIFELPGIIFFMILTIIWPLLAPIIAERVSIPRVSRWAREDYMSLARLADLNGDFYPQHGRHSLNFNAAAIAPSIRFVRKRLNQRLIEYQKKIPGSQNAIDCLIKAWEECQDLLKELLYGKNSPPLINIGLFSGTSRALEVVLKEMIGPKRIIVSPYEHPTETDVCEWLGWTSNYEVCCLEFDDVKDWEKHWTEQKKCVAEKITRSLSETATNVVILSEVCYATGLVIKVDEIIEEVKKKCQSERTQLSQPLKFIIDGAHAVGNMERPKALKMVGTGAVYIFSGHKWLMAPEPCGLVISPPNNAQKINAYDSWKNDLPKTTAGATMIFGLLSGVKLLHAIRIENRWSRSQDLLKRFMKKTRKFFAIIGANTGLDKTNMLSIKPNSSYKWKYAEAKLLAYLKDKSVSALVINIGEKKEKDIKNHEEESKFWVRLSFPYFLDGSDIDRICKILEEALVKS